MRSRDYGKNLLIIALKQKAFLAIIVLFIIMIFFQTNFYSSYNMLDILNSASINVILVAGVTLVIICGASDLSIGGTLSLSGIVTIILMNYIPIVPAILCALAVGALVGFINGFLVVQQKTEPFVITFGMGMVLKGICQLLTDAHPITPANLEFMYIANGNLFGTVPNLLIVMLVVLVIMHFVLRYTQFGRNCYAVGGDYEVAVCAGINARRIKWFTFVICGVMAAFAGIMLSSKLNSGSSTYGDATPLLIHCGAVIGGTSLIGGKGGVLQSFIGLLALAIMQNCMNMLGIEPYLQILSQGVVIAGILWMDCYGLKRKREAV